jgi:hypothetical protein
MIVYVGETWLPKLRNDQKGFKNKALRKIFGPKELGDRKNWRKLHEEF